MCGTQAAAWEEHMQQQHDIQIIEEARDAVELAIEATREPAAEQHEQLDASADQHDQLQRSCTYSSWSTVSGYTWSLCILVYPEIVRTPLIIIARTWSRPLMLHACLDDTPIDATRCMFYVNRA